MFQFASRMSGMREMLTAHAGLIAPSHFLADRFAGWIGTPTAIDVVENGLARTLIARPPRDALDDQPWVFGYFGQINPYKGVDVLLRAAEHFAAAGEAAGKRIIRIHGPLVGQSAEFVERLDRAVAAGVVEYSGPYQNEMVGDLMAACDYVVVPSLWWENSPVVIQEAYAAGRPLLVSGIGGMAEKVTDRVSGLHFAPGNVTDLLRAMAKASDPEAHARLTAQLPKTQTAEDMARAYLKVFRRAADPATSPAERAAA